jgi:hypothetical protein
MQVAKATEVVNSEWKEKDVLLDKILWDTNAGVRAINHELLLFCLVVLGGSGCHWLRSTIQMSDRSQDCDINCEESSQGTSICM